MTRLKQAMGACLLASTLLLTVETQAATYYVATTGNNSNPGTSSSPWQTVRHAVSKMVAGDTTYVRGGTYNESRITFARSGTSSAPIKLLNAPGQFPIINCTSNSQSTDNMVLFQNSSGYSHAIGWINLEGFEIRNCYNGIRFYNLHDSVIRRNWVHHNASAGLYGNGTRIVIDRNRINNNATATFPNHGLYMNGTAFTITNNLIYANYNYGIQLNGTVKYDATKHAGSAFALSANWVIENNTFAYQKNEAGLVVWGSTCNNTKIQNNIFHENAVTRPSYNSQGITFISTSCTGTQLRNNLAFASGSGGMKFTDGAAPGVTQSGNIVNTLNPGFVNAPATLPSAPNFALTSGSPAINKGLTTTATNNSYTNVTRPQQSVYDIGAFEFYTSSTSLAAPTSLQLAN